MLSLLFSFRGRISRAQYWLGSLGVGFGAVFLIVALALLTTPSAGYDKTSGPVRILMQMGLIVGPVWLLAAWAGLALQIKRFHDRGRSGMFTLLPLVPMTLMMVSLVGGIVSNAPVESVTASIQPYLTLLWLINLGFFIDLGCLPGQRGPNKYGDPPGNAPSPAPRPVSDPPPEPEPGLAFLGNAEKAIERAIAEQKQTTPARPAPAATRPVVARAQPAFAPASSPAGFGRRPAR